MPTLRSYRETDREACLALFDSNVPRFFAADERGAYAAFLDRLPGPYYVIEDAGRVIAGGGTSRHRSEPDAAILCWGMVEGGRHRSGIGRRLLEERLQRLFADEGVRTVVSNTSQHSAGFFARFGFETVAAEPDGFAPGIDRLEMRLTQASWRRRGGDRTR
jgi:L-amino acid N-acyltransferase YncA